MTVTGGLRNAIAAIILASGRDMFTPRLGAGVNGIAAAALYRAAGTIDVSRCRSDSASRDVAGGR